MSLIDRFDNSVDNLAGKFASLVGQDRAPGTSFSSLVGQGGGTGGGSMWGNLAGQGNGQGFSFGGLAGQGRAPFDMSWLGELQGVRGQLAADKAAQDKKNGYSTTGGTVTSTPVAGLSPAVSQWDKQTQATFGDLGGWVPNAMLAIIEHESGGQPTAYNKAGDAWGLFQQLHLNSNDPSTQFTAAKQLAQEKLASIEESYRRNGITPDDRTRARDLFLAWAGHFDYGTGQPNAGSRDIGSGQDYTSFLNEIMPMYDNIVKGRQQASAPGARPAAVSGANGQGGITTMLGGTASSVMQPFGVTDYSQNHPDTYAYGNAYGLQGSQHPGIDYGMALGSNLYSPVGGQVVYAGGTGYYTDTMSGVDPTTSGEYMVQMDNGDQIIVGHMQRINVNAGQRVNAGDFIGLSGGSDGAHAHLEVRQKQADGSYRIVDPNWYFGGR